MVEKHHRTALRKFEGRLVEEKNSGRISEKQEEAKGFWD